MKETQAYQAMVHILEDRYNRLRSGDLGALLGELSLQPDGRPADPAVVSDWERAVGQAGLAGQEQAAIGSMRRKAG